MRTLKILIYLVLLYGIFKQPIYLSSAQYENEIDPRVEKLEAFFAAYNSPLRGHAVAFVETADRNDLDWRLLPAIAGVESTFGKNVPNYAPFNPFGWRCNHIQPCWRFTGYDEAVRTVGEKIANLPAYKNWQRNKGNIRLLAIIYNGGDQKKWQRGVEYFMEKLKQK